MVIFEVEHCSTLKLNFLLLTNQSQDSRQIILKHQKMEVWNGISLAFWESLIASVQDFPYLYTKSDKRYKDTLLVENTWNHIRSNLKNLGFKLVAGVELNGTCVKNKWFSLRTKYIREKSDVKKPSGSGSDKREKWILFHHLNFLDKLTQTRQKKFPRISNLELEDNKTDRFDVS